MTKAVTLSDYDMAQLSLESVAWVNGNNPFAEAGAPYGKHLKTRFTGLTDEDALDLNFKVYLVSDINAFATPNGSMRLWLARWV